MYTTNKIVIGVSIFLLITILNSMPQEADSQTASPKSPERTEPESQPIDDQDGYQQVQGLETWRHEFDISDYSAGKYNIIIRGTDKAGNEYIEGPFNIFIDPESDKPVTNISNPEPQMRVNGNLNIIGTCIDDDSVAKVEVKLNDGEFQEAEGTEFWSYYLTTDTLEDGEYSLSARGIDVNGLAGNEVSTRFILDRSGPQNRVTSFENGALVNGKITLEGTLTDKNSVEMLEVSTDGRDSFNEVSIKSKRKDPNAVFKIKVDTRDLDDGPQIYWFRSIDKMGSSTLSSFLFFVDNQPPVLDVLFPTEDLQVNGEFTVVGRVSDEVGIESLSYEDRRGDPVEIPLSVGDPYWQQHFDYTGETKTNITFTLTDKTGNTSSYDMKLELDESGDRPIVELISPQADSKNTDGIISGFVRDDDEVKEIVYTLDGGDPVTLPAKYSFLSDLGELAPGEHKLELYAVDINEVKGATNKLSFTTVLGAPEIQFDSAVPSEGAAEKKLSQAQELALEEYKTINGTVFFQNKADKASLLINNGDEQKLSLKNTDRPKEHSFSFPLKNISTEFTKFTVKVHDEAGLSAEKSLFLMLKGPELAPADNTLYYVDDRFSSDGKVVVDPLNMSEDETIAFFLNGSAVRDARLTGDEDFLELQQAKNLVLLKAISSGYAEQCRIDIDAANGSRFTVGPFAVGSDEQAPKLQFETNLNGQLVGDRIEVSGSLSDNVRVSEFAYSLNGGDYKALPFEDEKFLSTISLQTEPEGGVHLNFRATDIMGNQTDQQVLLTKDTEPPLLEQLTPKTDISANGRVTFTGRTQDASEIRSIEFSDDGENFQPLDTTDMPVHGIDLSHNEEEPPEYSFRITDAAQNVATLVPQIQINAESDVPEVQIQVPQNGVLIQNDFTVYGMAFDDDEVDSILYRIDNGEFTETGRGNNFEIPVSIKDISDNAHTLEVKAVDLGGVESRIETLHFNVSKEVPFSSLKEPVIERTVKATVRLTGESSDENGISEVLLSYDNGNTFNRTELLPPETTPQEDDPQEADSQENEKSEDIQTSVQWTYNLNTELLEDGSHSLLIKAVDKYGVEGLYTTLINVDNTAPQMELTQPYEGLQTSKSIELKGRLTDNIQLAHAHIEIQQLTAPAEGEKENEEVPGGQPKRVTMELPLGEMLLQEIDLTDFSSGWINLRITAADQAGNRVSISRNIKKIENAGNHKLATFTPADGERLSGDVAVQGRIETLNTPEGVHLNIDGRRSAQLELSESGYFHTLIDQERLDEGPHTLSVEVDLQTGETLKTEETDIVHSEFGAWVKIDNFSAGDLVSDRPWISGTAGYNYHIPDMNEKDLKHFHKQREMDLVEISLDNGKTFAPAKGSEEWRFRLETQELQNGELWLLARARFKDGTSAISKTMVVVDETPPRVDLIYPSEGMRFNNTLPLIGTAADEYGLQDVSAALREGDKNRYQVPSFIQGLYIDSHFLGATYAELGIGLTFFDDNVKLQFQVGMAPPGRFTGAVLGVKLLANVAVLPWDYFLGYDWRFLSSSVAVGANFNYFTMSEDSIEFTDEGLVLGALIGQLELVKVNIPDWNMFSSFSFYTEGQLWFISSDVNGGINGKLAFGLRTSIF